MVCRAMRSQREVNTTPKCSVHLRVLVVPKFGGSWRYAIGCGVGCASGRVISPRVSKIEHLQKHTDSSSSCFFTRLRFSASCSSRLCLSSTCSSSCRWSSAFLLDSISCRLFVVLLSPFWLKLPSSPPNSRRDLSFSFIALLFLRASTRGGDCSPAALSVDSRRDLSSFGASLSRRGLACVVSGSGEVLPGLARRRLFSCSETSDCRRFKPFAGGDRWGSSSVAIVSAVVLGVGLLACD
jgi:hypothetical protein